MGVTALDATRSPLTTIEHHFATFPDCHLLPCDHCNRLAAAWDVARRSACITTRRQDGFHDRLAGITSFRSSDLSKGPTLHPCAGKSDCRIIDWEGAKHKPTPCAATSLTEHGVGLILRPQQHPHPNRSTVQDRVSGAEDVRRLLGRQRRASSLLPMSMSRVGLSDWFFPGQLLSQAPSIKSHDGTDLLCSLPPLRSMSRSQRCPARRERPVGPGAGSG